MIIYPDECKLSRRAIFDTHAHYEDPKFDIELDSLMNAMKQNGVAGILSCGCDVETSKKTLDIAHKYDFVYAGVGVHPEDVLKDNDLSVIEELAKDPKCVCIGEIGLDYYWTKDTKEKQLEVFENMLQIAVKLDMPVSVHDRNAHEDTFNLLKKYKPKGILHCFSGSAEMAREILKLGMYIGVGGVATFKNARKLPEVIEMLPSDRMVLETDCPFISPEPFRGEINHSGMITMTAKKIAEIRKTTLDDVLDTTLSNARTLFGI